MRTLTATEMDVVAGGTNSLIESLAQCTYDTLIGGAAGAAVGAALAGPAGAGTGSIIGMIAANLASDACNSL